MNTRKIPSGLLVLLLLVILFDSGMSQNRDAQLWTSVSAEVKLMKRLAAGFSQELRFNENMTEAGTIYTDLGVEYKLNKRFQVSVNYRFVEKRRKDNYYSFRQRIYIDFKYDEKIKPFQLLFRSRLQDEYADIGREPDGGVPEYYIRNRLGLKYDKWKKFSPYVSVEVFSPLNARYRILLDNLRSTAGIEYAFTKHHKADVFYMIQKEINVSHPETDFVVGLGYSYKL